MGVCNPPDIFQEKINGMFRGLGLIREYINDILIITKCDSYDHFNKLLQVLKNRKNNRLKYNIDKSFFRKTDMEYLVF